MDEQEGYRIHQWGGPLQWGRFPVATPGPGEARVRVDACGIGLTVRNYMAGNLTTREDLLPRVPGHELTGVVTEAGAGAEHLRGRRVVTYFYLSCGTCTTCQAGDEPRCRNLEGWVGTHRDGGYAPWTVLPARNLVPVPADMDPIAATVVPDALATPVHVCRRRARVGPGDRVVVIGAGGGVGMHMIQVARLLGGEVAGLDLTDPKMEAVEGLGAIAHRADDLDRVDPAMWHDGGPTVVIDLVGTSETLDWGLRALEPGGRQVVVTTVREGGLTVVPRDLVFREIAVMGSRYARRSEIATAASLVRSGRVRPIVGAVVDPPDVPAVHAMLAAGTLLGRGAVRWDHAGSGAPGA